MKRLPLLLFLANAMFLSSSFARAAAAPAVAAVQPVPNPCPRFAPGSVIQREPALFSQNGVLAVRFSYQTVKDAFGRTLFCFMTPDGLENPTLYVFPGDHLKITITNNTTGKTGAMAINHPNCGAATMYNSSVNIHYHGTNTSPTCGSDEVIKTLINPHQTFQYDIAFPNNEPPGLYWYHPHVHGLAENALLGGASGAIVVRGIENVQPKVAGLRSRVLVIRDQHTKQFPGVGEGTGGDPNGVPFQDLTINNVPLDATTDTNGITTYTPAILHVDGDDPEFWRVTNSSSDTILDLQVQYDGVPQTLQLVAVDGVAVNSQDGTKPGSTIPITDFRLPPASRMEFIVQPPAPSVKLAQLITLNIPALSNGNGAGDDDPTRPIFNIQLGDNKARAAASKLTPGDRMGESTVFTTAQQRFAGIRSAPIAARRLVYFDENQATQQFFMAVQGQPEAVFNANAPPAITAKQGTVEEWTVENHALENHEFHFHQVHFMVESQNNFKVNSFKKAPAIDGQFLDMIEVPAWDGNLSDPFPSVTLLIDFRGPDVGTFVFHCHILNHEDQGMMNIVQVVNDDAQAKAPATDKVAGTGAKMEMKMNMQGSTTAVPSALPATPASPSSIADPGPASTTGGSGHLRE